MGTKNPIRTSALLALFGLFSLFAAWCAGFLYWEFTLTRAVRKLHHQIADLRPKEGEFPSERLEHLHEFDGAMSRGVPILISETERALAKQDKVTACILIHYLSMAVSYADAHGEWELQPSPHIKLRSSDESLEDLRAGHRTNLRWWEENRKKYPPSWMWWTGTRREQ
jgi:hypothetical protein